MGKGPKIKSPLERIAMKGRSEANGCWVFEGHLREGYGTIHINGRGKAKENVHRVVYEALRGPIPAGCHLDHLCRNKACFNPDHLEPVTPRENIRRSLPFQKPRAQRCSHDRSITTYVRPNGRVKCKACEQASPSRQPEARRKQRLADKRRKLLAATSRSEEGTSQEVRLL